MVRRPPGRALTALVVAASACAPHHAPAPPLQRGDPAPAVLRASAPGRVRVSWVFDARDLTRCRSSARELRHVEARFGPGVQDQAVAVDGDTGMVRSFMRVQRVHAPVRYVSRREAAKTSGLAWPALYVVRDDTVRRVFPGIPLDDARSLRERDVEGAVLSSIGRPGTSAVSSDFRRRQ